MWPCLAFCVAARNVSSGLTLAQQALSLLSCLPARDSLTCFWLSFHLCLPVLHATVVGSVLSPLDPPSPRESALQPLYLQRGFEPSTSML